MTPSGSTSVSGKPTWVTTDTAFPALAKPLNPTEITPLPPRCCRSITQPPVIGCQRPDAITARQEERRPRVTAPDFPGNSNGCWFPLNRAYHHEANPHCLLLHPA